MVNIYIYIYKAHLHVCHPLYLSFQMQSLDSVLLYPVDRLLKTELRGSKGDLKRPFDRAWKDYNEKYTELERQKKKAAKEAGENEFDFVMELGQIIMNITFTLIPEIPGFALIITLRIVIYIEQFDLSV